MKHLLPIASALLLACAVVPAHADTVTYSVVVDTHSQAGNSGYIDLMLNGGFFGAPDVTATVTQFSGATLNSGDPMNETFGISGSLPGPLSFDNQSTNDYFEGITFGNQLSFLVTLSGDGVSPSGGSTSDTGADFQVAFIDSSNSTYLFSNDPNGTEAEIDVAADGTLAATAQSNASVAATPEPATLSLVGMAGALVGAIRHRRRRAV